jgi:hypothetical protein
MKKRLVLYFLLLPVIILFYNFGGGTGDGESGPVTRLLVSVTYNGDLVGTGVYIGVALNKTDELVASGGFTLPGSTVMPSSAGHQKNSVKGTEYVVE